MKTYLNEYSGLWLTVICWLAFVVLVAVLIGSAPSVDRIVWGR